MKKSIVFILTGFFLLSCTTQKEISFSDQTRLHFIGEYDLPHNKVFQNTTVGGLSGIDYDAKHAVYYLICDDRSAIDPARFYTARIYLNEKGIDSVQLVSVKNLLQPNGKIYPNARQDPFHTPDPEAMRFNPVTKRLIWSSEGERIIRKDAAVLQNPSINIIDTDGNYIDSFALPPNMRMQPVEKGPRQNGVFEGLSFTHHYKKLLVSVEEPLYEDGTRAGLNDSSGWIRFIRFDIKSRKPEMQYAYPIDPVAYPAQPSSAFKINGVSDILSVNNHQLLVIERSFSTGRKPCTIKVYLAELNGASDVSGIPSLKNGRFRPVTKKLLLNMDSLGIYTDNIEGVSLGPRLAGGESTLIFVADNNFSAEEITQFLLFKIE